MYNFVFLRWKQPGNILWTGCHASILFEMTHFPVWMRVGKTSIFFILKRIFTKKTSEQVTIWSKVNNYHKIYMCLWKNRALEPLRTVSFTVRELEFLLSWCISSTRWLAITISKPYLLVDFFQKNYIIHEIRHISW